MKIRLKVIKDKQIQWVTFCSVPDKIYNEFDKRVHLKPLDFNVYLSMWVKDDFMVLMTMDRATHLDQLKQMILTRYKRSYPELYIFKGITIDEDFWIAFWVASHMKTEQLK